MGGDFVSDLEDRVSYGDPSRTSRKDAESAEGYCESIDCGDGRSIWKGGGLACVIDGETIAVGGVSDIDAAAEKLRSGATAKKTIGTTLGPPLKLAKLKRLSRTPELGAFAAVVGPTTQVTGRFGAGAAPLFETVRKRLAPNAEITREPGSVNELGFDMRMKNMLIAGFVALLFFIALMEHFAGEPVQADGGNGRVGGRRGGLFRLAFSLTHAAGPVGTGLLLLAAIGWTVFEFLRFRRTLPERDVVTIPR